MACAQPDQAWAKVAIASTWSLVSCFPLCPDPQPLLVLYHCADMALGLLKGLGAFPGSPKCCEEALQSLGAALPVAGVQAWDPSHNCWLLPSVHLVPIPGSPSLKAILPAWKRKADMHTHQIHVLLF